MREIIYEERTQGVFTPRPTRAERDKAKKLKRQRDERFDAIIGYALMALAVAVWVVAHFVIWGGVLG